MSFAGQQYQQPQQQQYQQPQLNITPTSLLLTTSLLSLLTTCITHSPSVRIALSSNAQFRCIPVLVSLIPLAVPLELKGVIFGALAEFCEAGAGEGGGVPMGSAGVEICRGVWGLMERLEVINVRPAVAAPSGFGMSMGGMGKGRGVEVELEDVESVHKMYPSTIPFLRLLCALIHTPKRVPIASSLTSDSSPSQAIPTLNTIPDTLGTPYRSPGIAPYTSFVLNDVFAKISGREYVRGCERWEMNDSCLGYVERCLGSWDGEGLRGVIERVGRGGGGGGAGEMERVAREWVGPLLVHPGYDILVRFLSNSGGGLQTTILSYVSDGIAGFEKNFEVEEPYFGSTIVRALRILLRVLEVQDIFLEVLLPLIGEIPREMLGGVGMTTYPRSYFTRLDPQSLTANRGVVPSIGAYVVFAPSHPELGLLAVKILRALALTSPGAGGVLGTMIEGSEESDRIMDGFCRILDSEGEGGEWVEDVEGVVERMTGAGARDPLEGGHGGGGVVEMGVRGAVLGLFVEGTTSGTGGMGYPNLVHFLLFGSMKGESQGIQDPRALGGRETCVHVVLRLLSRGVPTEDGAGGGEGRALFASLPELVEKCYKLVYQLCVHPRTSAFVMRYLRTREDFFARQLKAIPAHAPASTITNDNAYLELQYADGSRVSSSVAGLTAFLRLRSWVFDLVALEMHVLTSKGMGKGVSRLLGILFGHEATSGGDHQPQQLALGWGDEEDGYEGKPFREIGQSHMRVIEFVQSLRFDWADSLGVSLQDVELKLLAGLDLLSSTLRLDANGCEIIDRSALLAVLADGKRQLHARGLIVTPAQLEQLSTEIAYVLQSCAVENHRRQVRHATGQGYEAWRRLLDVTLTKCFGRLPHGKRENMLFEILHVLPESIKDGENVEERTAVLLSEAVLSCMTKLREDRHRQVIMQDAYGEGRAGGGGGGGLPAERLHALLRSVIECLLERSRVELVRGNLYAALISYLHLIFSPEGGFAGAQAVPTDNAPRALAMSTALMREETNFGSSRSGTPGPSAATSSPLFTGSLALIKAASDRLIAAVARDAIDGAEVWKTIAFMLLDALVQVSRTDSKSHVVLTSMVRSGVLGNFVRGIKEEDGRLMAVLRPDPGSLFFFSTVQARC